MATTVVEAINRTRRYLRDFGAAQDQLTASVTSSATILTVADASTAIYSANWVIEVEQEAMLVVSGTGTTLTVRRGYAGSTAVSHANSSTVLIRPAYFSVDILDALTDGIQACYPLVYKQVIDETISTTAQTYEYTIPAMPSDSGVVIPYLSKVSIKEPGDFAFRDINAWDVKRGAIPKLRFRRQQTPGSIVRLEGFGPFPALTAGGSYDAQFPRQVDELPSLYAAGWLLGSGEAWRTRFDQGMRDDREQAVRAGSAMQAGNALINRFYKRLTDGAMPAMPRHVVSTI